MRHLDRDRLRQALFIATLCVAGRLPAQVVSGRIYDSVAKAPLVGATVQLVSSTPGTVPPAETTSDSLGRYAFTTAAPGSYTLGFYHAVLDSIGIDPPFVRLQVAGQPVQVDLAVPGPTQILTAMCGKRARKDSLGVLIGHLYDAETREGVKDGEVIADWYTVRLVNGKIEATTPRAIGTTTSSGWFAICNVPRDDDVILEGIRGGDTTGATPVHVPSNGIAQRALFVDKTEIVAVAPRDSAGAPDTTRSPERVHRGSARLAGTIVDANGGRPIAGADVTVEGAGLRQLTDGRGAFTISGAPGGTQVVTIRAVGYLPERRTVALVRDDASPLNVRLTKLRTVLDTMRITASRVFATDGTGFEHRRRMGGGTFFDSADVARANVFEPSHLLERVGGVHLYGSGATERVFMDHLGSVCEPTIFIDGATFPDFTAADLNALVMPEEIVAMEVYTSAASAPVQYKSMTSDARSGRGCGSVVVWTTRSR